MDHGVQLIKTPSSHNSLVIPYLQSEISMKFDNNVTSYGLNLTYCTPFLRALIIITDSVGISRRELGGEKRGAECGEGKGDWRGVHLPSPTRGAGGAS